MANPRALLKRRRSVSNTRKLTKTMEMVSTAKLARAQQAAVAARPYARKLQQVVAELAAASGALAHPLLETRAAVRKACVLLLTSDRGLCAAFNANLIREAARLEEELRGRGAGVEFITQGKKGHLALRRRGWREVKTYLMVSDKPSYPRAEEIGNGLIQRFVRGELDEAHVVYSSFRSMLSQTPTVRMLLPLAAQPRPAAEAAAPVEYLYHPGAKQILADLLPLMVKTAIFTAMLESCAGEHSARRVAMKNATDAADEMIKTLTQHYNRARQGKITQEIAEIVGGAQVQ